MSIVRKAGTTDVSVVIRIIDSADGTPETGVTSATSGLDLEYRREGAVSVDITESDLSALTDAHSDGGLLHIGGGYYRLDLPDAAVAAGATGVLVHGVATGMVILGEYVQLVAYDPFESVRLGLTALPNAAADAAGGLPISDAGGLDLDTKLANTNEITVARMGALTDWIDGGRLDLIVDAILTDTGTTLQAELDGIQADTEDIQTRLPAALVSGRMDSNMQAAATGVITATVIADGAIDAATFAADVDAEILSYLVDDATRIDASALNTASGAIGSDGTGLTEAGGTGDHLTAILAYLDGLVIAKGTIGATGNDTTHLHLAGLTYGDDEINNYLLAVKDVSTGEWHARYIEDWADTGDLATVATLPFTPEASVDQYVVLAFRQDVTGGAGLDAAGVRAAIGLAAANLDTQLGTIDSNVDEILVDTGTTLDARIPAALTGAGNMKADVLAVSGSTTAADNVEIVFDTDFATNYNTTLDKWSVNTSHVNAVAATSVTTINAVLGTSSAITVTSGGVTLADGVTHGGTTAMMRLGSSTSTPALYVTNSGGVAAQFETTAGNNTAFYCQGFGTGAGFRTYGGASGEGLRAVGGATTGQGILGYGQGQTGELSAGIIGQNLNANGGIGIVANGTVAGAKFIGDSSGVNTRSMGLWCEGTGTEQGIYIRGGATAAGLLIAGGVTSGNAVTLLTAGGEGIATPSINISGALTAGTNAVPWNASWLGAEMTDLGGMSTTMKAQVNAEMDTALNTAIPGTPTADSINERVKTLDDAYTVARAGYLENVNNVALATITVLTIADQVWDEAIAGHVGVGSTGEALNGATAPTAGAVADAVWDEAAADHNAAGSMGQKLNASGAAADPLLSTVPGSYLAGTAGYALGRIDDIETAVDIADITVLGPTLATGDIVTIAGDSYENEHSRAIQWQSTGWTDLTGLDVNVNASKGGTVRTYPATVVDAGEATQIVRLELTDEETAALPVGEHDLTVVATNGTTLVATLVGPTATSRRKWTNVQGATG